MKNSSNLFVLGEAGMAQEKILCILGEGGSKKAIQISGNRALMLPNMNVDPTKDIAERWERMVCEEVKMSEILSRIGLLSPLAKQVSISLTESSKHVIPAYVCETFDSSSLKGCFIVDSKNRKSSTWKQGLHFLFQSEADRWNEENWHRVLDSFLTDVAKICLWNVPAEGDALNFAVVEKPCKSAICQYEIRYYGFDFSSKHGSTVIPDVENKPEILPNIDKAKRLVEAAVNKFIFLEFDQRDDNEMLTELKKKLKEKCVKIALVKIQQLQCL
jgi:hypothetical protein